MDIYENHCNQFAKHIADKIVHIQPDLDTIWPTSVFSVPRLPLVMDSFHLVQPEGVDRKYEVLINVLVVSETCKGKCVLMDDKYHLHFSNRRTLQLSTLALHSADLTRVIFIPSQ